MGHTLPYLRSIPQDGGWHGYWRPGFLPTAKKQLFGKTQNPALAVSRKMKDAAGVLGANLRLEGAGSRASPTGRIFVQV